LLVAHVDPSQLVNALPRVTYFPPHHYLSESYHPNERCTSWLSLLDLLLNVLFCLKFLPLLPVLLLLWLLLLALLYVGSALIVLDLTHYPASPPPESFGFYCFRHFT
jgi:hypothetical protein